MSGRVTPEHLEQLLAAHGAALELYASQWTNAPEDCVQEAFLQLVRQPALPDAPAAWLFRVVRNRAISRLRASQRRRRRERECAVDGDAWFETPADPMVDGEQLQNALRSLDDGLREVIIARVWGGLSFEEIARVVGASSSSTHRRYERGLRMLRERLGVKCLNRTTCQTS